MAQAIFRLLSRTLALLPLEEGQRDLLKAFVYRRAGGLFERSPNYHYWKRAHPERKARTRWPGLRAPAEAEWDALAPRPGAGATGAPFIVVPVFRGRDETLACAAQGEAWVQRESVVGLLTQPPLGSRKSDVAPRGMRADTLSTPHLRAPQGPCGAHVICAHLAQ